MNTYAAYYVIRGLVDPTGQRHSSDDQEARDNADRRDNRRGHDQQEENRRRYPKWGTYHAGLRAFEQISDKVDPLCEECCLTDEEIEACKEEGQRLEKAIKDAWEMFWGQPNCPVAGVQNLPIPPNVPNEGRGGYFCYDWSRIFKNAAMGDYEHIKARERRYLYKGNNRELFKKLGRLPAHFYLEVTVLNSEDKECGKFMVDNGFDAGGQTQYVHGPDYPLYGRKNEDAISGRGLDGYTPGESEIPLVQASPSP